MTAADAPERSNTSWWSEPRQVWPKRIIVMRHAEHSNGVLTKTGCTHIEDVARALAEWCFFTKVTVASFDGITLIDGVGAEVMATEVRMQASVESASKTIADGNVEARAHVDDDNLKMTPTYRPDKGSGDPHLIVLNEPQAGRLVKALSGANLELRRGELVLLERRGHLIRVGPVPIPWGVRYRARWTMAPRVPKGDPLLVAVREKIASKMRTAGVLGGLITSLLTFVLTQLFGGNVPWGTAAFAAFVALAVSATLFFVSMFYYDSLTMPSQFWGPGRDEAPSSTQGPNWLLARPPSATSRVLQLNMVRIWSYVFRPAILALGVGIGALLFALDGAPTATTAPTTATTTAESTTAVSTTAPAATTTAVSTTAVATTTMSTSVDENDDVNGGDNDNSVDLGRSHATALIVAGLLTAGWSYRFRPQIGASD